MDSAAAKASSQTASTVDLQANRHAPGLKVVVYDGMAGKTPKDEDQEKKKRKSKKSFKKMSREERFKTSAVRPFCYSPVTTCRIYVHTICMLAVAEAPSLQDRRQKPLCGGLQRNPCLTSGLQTRIRSTRTMFKITPVAVGLFHGATVLYVVLKTMRPFSCAASMLCSDTTMPPCRRSGRLRPP